MHFDDRLATVLQMPIAGQAIQRIQYRQLVDLLGQPERELGNGPVVEAAFARLHALEAAIPAAERGAILRDTATRIANRELVMRLVTAEPEIAIAAIAAADLTEDQWLDLIPELPVRARGILRHRRDLGDAVDLLLDRLGIADRGLPAAAGSSAERLNRPELVVAPGGGSTVRRSTQADQPAAGIGAIVRRIEAFRKARAGSDDSVAEGDPLALQGLGTARATVLAVDFTTDAAGRINWADGPLAPGLIGLALSNLPVPSAALANAMRLRQPLRNSLVTLPGAPDLAGEWQLNALPRFDHIDGRFLGYTGRIRRGASSGAPSGLTDAADSMRQILHELRTPANAIQIAAEIIQQQLYGPAPHEYRALAAAIAGDTAQILAGFDELDRLVKLEIGALHPASGEADLARIVAETVDRLHTWTNPRGSGFMPTGTSDPLRVGLDHEDTARLVWRLLAALAGAAAPGETLVLDLDQSSSLAVLAIDLPTGLAERLAQAQTNGHALDAGRSLSSGMFGVGFTLRLVAAEAKAAGVSLERAETQLRLQLPGLTLGTASHTQA